MENTVGSIMSGTLGLPIIRKFMEYKAIITKMLASKSMIFRLTFSQPVIIPAPAPASVATRVETKGSTPLVIKIAATAPPKGKLPSTVKSGKRSTRKEINTPKATRLKISPISSAPHNEYIDIVKDNEG